MCLLTSEAHSCSVPTIGIKMLVCEHLSHLASNGMPPALRIAFLFLVLLLQLQSAKAPHRAVSVSSASNDDSTEIDSNSST